MYKATLKSNGIARHYYGCSETEFKPVSTTTNKALYIDAKEMPRNCRRRSGMPKTQKQTLASNGVLRQKLVHVNREQNRATSDLPRNSLFYNPTPLQYLTNDQSFTANAAQKQVQIEKFYCAVLLIESDVMPDVVSISSRHFPASASAFNEHLPPVVRFLAIFHFFTNSRLLTITFLKLYCPA